MCSGEWIREQERGGSYKEGGFSVQRERGSTRHGDFGGGRSSPGISRLAANALWSGPPIPSLGVSPLSCKGRGGVPNILGCAVRPVSAAQDKAPASPHPSSPDTQASCPAGSHVCEEPSPQHRDIGLSPVELRGRRGTSGWIPVLAQPGRGLAPGGEAASPGHSARRAAGRAAGLAGGRPWAGPPAPRVAVQVGTMTLSRHASFSHSNFGAAGQRGRFIIVGLDQQPARPEPRCPRPAQAPGPGRPTAQLGQSPATLSPLAQPHPSRDPLAFLAFCPFGPSQSWGQSHTLGAPEDPRFCPLPSLGLPPVAEKDSQAPSTSATLTLKARLPTCVPAPSQHRRPWPTGAEAGEALGLSPRQASAPIWPFCGMSQLKTPSAQPQASLPPRAAGPEARAHTPHHSPASSLLLLGPGDWNPSPQTSSLLHLARECAGASREGEQWGLREQVPGWGWRHRLRLLPAEVRAVSERIQSPGALGTAPEAGLWDGW